MLRTPIYLTPFVSKVVVGSQTIKLQLSISYSHPIIIGDQSFTYQNDRSDYIINSQTLKPGSQIVTIASTLVIPTYSYYLCLLLVSITQSLSSRHFQLSPLQVKSLYLIVPWSKLLMTKPSSLVFQPLLSFGPSSLLHPPPLCL